PFRPGSALLSRGPTPAVRLFNRACGCGSPAPLPPAGAAPRRPTCRESGRRGSSLRLRLVPVSFRCGPRWGTTPRAALPRLRVLSFSRHVVPVLRGLVANRGGEGVFEPFVALALPAQVVVIGHLGAALPPGVGQGHRDEPP